MSYQKVIIVGQGVHTPQYRKGGDGVIQATRLQLLTEYPMRNGEVERNYHTVLAYGNLADIAQQGIHKGIQVHAEGRLRTRRYQGRDGVERWTTEVIADMLDFRGEIDVTEGRSEGSQEAS